MFSRANLARRFLLLRTLRGGLVAGSVLDLTAAWAAAWRPATAGELLRVTLPGEALYLRLTALMLTVLALLNLVAASDVRRYSAVIVLAALGRLAGALLILGAAGRPGTSLAVAELAIALLVLATWNLVRK